MKNKILIIDDQTIFTQTINEIIINEIKKEVINTSSIDEGLDALIKNTNEIALILLDVAMPKSEQLDININDSNGLLTGLNAVPILKNKMSKDTKIWLVTVRAHDITEDQLKSVGISRDCLFIKPLNIKNFIKELKSFFNIQTIVR